MEYLTMEEAEGKFGKKGVAKNSIGPLISNN
jgi:hypothetical protein